MKKYLLATIMTTAAFVVANGQQLTVNAPDNHFIELTPEASTGLRHLYVIENGQAATISYRASTANVSWQRFSNLGGGYAEAVPGVQANNGTYSITAGSSDMGYIIDDGTTRLCFWVVNYANHRIDLRGLAVDPELSDCNRVSLTVAGSAAPITYYSVNGRPMELSRDLQLSYRDLEYDESAGSWQQTERTETLASVDGHAGVQAPYCDTEFTLSGDRFSTTWGDAQSVSSPSYQAVAVTARVSATQTEHEGADNESDPGVGEGLGGSAPCEITFRAAPTDAAVFKEWQMSRTEDFDDITDRYAQDELTYTFNDEGTTYVRFECADASGNCLYDSETFTVNIGASKLMIPNAFSPANQDGVNDLWKVSYTSIVKFECSIFNRWGQRMATLTHPSQGWDGKYKGKFVPAGVYFYVIKATGADGKKYDKAGDINIVDSRRNTFTGGEETVE